MGVTKDDPIKALADSLREKKGVPWSSAKLEAHDGDGHHVEYFRGKDFARFFRSNPDKLNQHVPAKLGKTTEDQIAELMMVFMRRKLVRKTDRKFKKPKPGKKRLVKFPRTLVPHQDGSGWTESAFYYYTYDRPTSIWYYVATVALPFLVIAACLFPLAPWWVRMTLVYFLMAVLALLLGLIAVRYSLFGLVWIASGHSFWLFPNLMSDEVSVFDAFAPVMSYDKPKKGSRTQIAARVLTLALAAGTVYMLYQNTPDAEQLAATAKEAHDSILDYLPPMPRRRDLVRALARGRALVVRAALPVVAAAAAAAANGTEMGATSEVTLPKVTLGCGANADGFRL
ncbi:Translocation protein SEC62 [Tetrabaena socialis]|uniref:Translocation protein SEC62 n=1 Tax=Tetrabaena socialis TaxID=47790 RepID=A0A2J8AG81_9CHLO|nr:Translocation protein SEC62 [Tetrabaena socialis]|eukprot:PNH11496.1 Translocation protein SEC62 [Tetrabaena socialis]